MTGARLARFKIIVLKLHEYCCHVAFMQYWIQSIVAKIENSYLRERWSQTREHPRFLFT